MKYFIIAGFCLVGFLLLAIPGWSLITYSIPSSVSGSSSGGQEYYTWQGQALFSGAALPGSCTALYGANYFIIPATGATSANTYIVAPESYLLDYVGVSARITNFNTTGGLSEGYLNISLSVNDTIIWTTQQQTGIDFPKRSGVQVNFTVAPNVQINKSDVVRWWITGSQTGGTVAKDWCFNYANLAYGGLKV